MLKLKITQRALLLFVIISVTPVVALNTYWLHSQQMVLRNEAEKKHQLMASFAADRTNSFLINKVNALILHSQTKSVLSLNKNDAEMELRNYLKQDGDVTRAVLLRKDGTTLVDLEKNPGNHSLGKLADKEINRAFKVVTFAGGKEYISPVFYDNERAFIVVSVPLVTFTKDQNINSLSTSERGVMRGDGDINGALSVVVDLSSTLTSALATSDSGSGVSYVLSSDNKLIAHKDPLFMKAGGRVAELEAQATSTANWTGSGSVEMTGSGGTRVLAAISPIPATGWRFVNETPLASITAEADAIAGRVMLLNLLLALLAGGLAFLFSYRITKPITDLAKDAEIIGNGNFDQPIATIDRYDEIGSLSRSLSAMGQRLKSVIGHISGERDQLNFVLNSVGEGIFVLDAQGGITLANAAAAKIFNVDPKVFPGKPFKDLAEFKQDVAQVTVDPLEIDEKERVVEFRDLQFTDSFGKKRYADIIIAKISSNQNNISSIATVIDQTANRELEAMKVDFVSLAAHELRTPLTAIRGYLELTLKDKNPVIDDKHRRFLLQANDSSSQLVSLINNLLNVSKIERSSLKMAMDRIDWAKIVSSSAANSQFSAEKSKVTLTYTGPASGVEILGDPVAIREVVDNFIANALHYTPEKGSVSVSLEVTDKEVITHVKDTGIGISEENQKKLFTKFYRVHGGLATGSGGSGLGLYISKSIVELHHGRIWVESKEGVGSTFSFALPLFDEATMGGSMALDKTAVRRKRGWITKNTTS